MEKIDAQSWSVMWKNPTITTFGTTNFVENYDGAILEFWATQLQGEFNHVVDLACGNGALTWIANDLLNAGERKTSITGIDFADIRPFETLKRRKADYPAVSFIGNSPIEQLPFGDGAIDMVISQYGLEYSDLDQSIPEIARVLGPKGKMSLIVHDRDGDLVKGEMLALDNYRTMLDIIRLDECILNLARIHEKTGQAPAQQHSGDYEELIGRIDSLRSIFQSIVARFPMDPTVDNYNKRLEFALGEAKKKRNKRKEDLDSFIENARHILSMSIERKEDLVAASLTRQELKRLMARIKKAGFAITERRPLIHKEQLNWGTILVAERAPAGGLFARLKRQLGQSDPR